MDPKANVSKLQVGRELEPLLNLEETGTLLGRSHWTLRRDIAAGRIRCVRIGRRIMVERDECRRIIAEGRQTGESM
jgi:hypothetical protein